VFSVLSSRACWGKKRNVEFQATASTDLSRSAPPLQRHERLMISYKQDDMILEWMVSQPTRRKTTMMQQRHSEHEPATAPRISLSREGECASHQHVLNQREKDITKTAAPCRTVVWDGASESRGGPIKLWPHLGLNFVFNLFDPQLNGLKQALER
jgi:hypothetical protein